MSSCSSPIQPARDPSLESVLQGDKKQTYMQRYAEHGAFLESQKDTFVVEREVKGKTYIYWKMTDLGEF